MAKELLVVTICAIATCAFLVPFVKHIALSIGAVDKPNARKVHQKVMPRMGGLAIYAAYWIVVFTFMPFDQPMQGFFVGATMLVIVGIVDDVTDMPAKLKLLGQIIAACIPTFAGVRIEFVTSFFSDTGMHVLSILSVPVTVIWIVAIINAVNLIDGLDGLAAGVSCISALTLATVSVMNGDSFTATMCFILVGACIGFLFYNFHPASIFMGDTGSMFLGYTLAVLSIIGMGKGITFVSVFIPVLALGIPIFDTLFAIVRRMLANKPIFEADKEHLHHCLLNRGLTHRGTVLFIYAISLGLSLCAIIINELTNAQAFLVLVIALTLLLVGAGRLGILGSKLKQQITKPTRGDRKR